MGEWPPSLRVLPLCPESAGVREKEAGGKRRPVTKQQAQKAGVTMRLTRTQSRSGSRLSSYCASGGAMPRNRAGQGLRQGCFLGLPLTVRV